MATPESRRSGLACEGCGRCACSGVNCPVLFPEAASRRALATQAWPTKPSEQDEYVRRTFGSDESSRES